MQCNEHIYNLVDDPFSVFPAHIKSTEKWKDAIIMAMKHRKQVLFYFESRRLIDAEEFGLVLSSRVYYNSIRKEKPNKNKPHMIETLLLSLHHKDFIYYIKVSEEKNESNKIIIRKFIQLFFIYRK
jgi:hypothetical protein